MEVGTALNALDVALLVVLAIAAARGILAGALAQVLPIGGLVLGLVGGAAMAPVAERLVEGGTARVLVSLVVVFGAALLCAGAGIEHPVVHTGRGAREASPVVFDPELDIAVLRLSSAAGRPLGIVTTEVATGTPAAVLGYPGGGPLRASAASVAASYQAIGCDVYSRGLARRPVYELRGRIGSGNSGGPVVNVRGEVIGVIFSRSALHEDVAFAIRGEAVASKVVAVGRAASGSVTGRCAA